jgi:branched-chain amino acid transport system permease protein
VLAVTAGQLSQGLATGLVLSAVYALVALGLALVFSILKIINFAHGDFVMLGAVGTFFVFGEWGAPFAVALVAVSVGGFLVGAVSERLIFRPFTGDLLAAFVVSLGFAWVLQMLAMEVFGSQPRSVPAVLDGTLTIAGGRITYDRLLMVAAGVAVVAAVGALLYRTNVGRAMRAVAQNRDAAELLGVNASRVTAFGFALGAALACMAGALIAPVFSVTVEMGVQFSIKAFIVIILGGMGSLAGAVLAALVLGLGEGLAGLAVSNSTLTLAEFLLVVLVLVLRPGGLLGVERD